MSSAALATAYRERRWYACHTRARHEKRVATMLGQRGIDGYLPLLRQVRQWKDRRKEVSVPLFPGYVFAFFSLSEMTRVLSVPGVATVVRANGRPAPIQEAELENVRLFERALSESGSQAAPVPYVEVGQPVVFRDGAFAGVRGVVLERRNRRRVLVGIEAIGKGWEIDIEAGSLELIAV
jgi:transcription antitermination factor NusG